MSLLPSSNCVTCSGRCQCSLAQLSFSAHNKASSNVLDRFFPESGPLLHAEHASKNSRAHARRVKDQHVSHPNNDQTTDNATADATSAFCALGDLDTPTDAAQAGVGKDGLPSGSLLLVVKRGPNAGSRFRLDQPVTSAGRHPDSGIFLDDVSVSRRHAEFRRENGDYSVVDTGSLNGTYVNRTPVESVALANGDEIQMGKFRLIFLQAHDALTPTRPAPIGQRP
jgi:hypothetical protein